MIAEYDGDITNLYGTTPEGVVPILATRNMVMFPAVISPILVGREQSVNLLNYLDKHPGTLIAIFSQKNPDIEHPREDDLYRYGCYAKLVRRIELPGSENCTAIFQMMGRCHLDSIEKTRPYLCGAVSERSEIMPDVNDKAFNTAMIDLVAASKEFIHKNDELADEMVFSIDNIHNPIISLNFLCTALPFSVKDKMELLEESNLMDRALNTLRLLNRELQFLQLRNQIRMKTREELDEQQREYFLQQQIKNIKEELGRGEGSPEKRELEEKARNKKWSSEVAKVFEKELEKLDILNPQSPDYSVQLNYLQTYVSLPWGEYTQDDLDLKRAQRILDHDHYGMEKVKERILEYIAVLKLRGDLKSPIICLYGPPGVGKTSLGKSIASALRRKYVRVSLGGLHDESEIRGHRRTYIGAMPGRIIKNLQKAGSANPVFVLDEIDKVTQNTINGDPSSALLEVLDPEQNNAFHDNYLDVDFDLSNVLFIATANDLNPIPRPLLDRMELIEVSGYITEEKIEIAKRHLVPRELKNNGLDKHEPKIKFSKSAIEKVVESYTRESGVRQLEKQIGKTMRKIAYQLATGDGQVITTIRPDDIETLIGKPPFYRDIYQGNDYAGVVTGLAWTSVGGEILFIETSLSKGHGSKLTLTGNLGDVMKESVQAAVSYLRTRAEQLHIPSDFYKTRDIHVHFPEGAVPKDGPSAGITMATAMLSAVTGKKVCASVAMTGEITLRGRVLPIGGLKEKTLAARMAHMKKVLVPDKNRPDMAEISKEITKGMEIVFVKTMDDVVREVFV